MARYDLARFGAEVFRPSPRAGGSDDRRWYCDKKRWHRRWCGSITRCRSPKYVIAMGACAISGGPFKQGYNVLKGIDRYIPVDVHIPGLPSAS